MADPILSRMRGPTPEGPIHIDDEEHTFRVYESEGGADAPKTVYVLDKAPFIRIKEVRATIDGKPRELSAGDEYETRDVSGTDEDDAIAFIDSTALPDKGETFSVSYVAKPTILKYAEQFDGDVEDIEAIVADVVDSHQVENAEGDQLDLLGAIFELVGQRSGLGDDNYRALLESIVPTLSANGTLPGLRRAVAITVGVDESDVVINEDFEKNGYTVDINAPPTQRFSGSVLDGVLDSADPSGVELLKPPILRTTAEVTFDSSSTVSETGGTDRLGGGTLGSGELG